MKQTKRILAILTCVLLLMGSISVTAFAAGENGNCSITIVNPSEDTGATVAGKTFYLYKIFDATSSGANTSYSWIKKEGANLYESFFFGTNGFVKDSSGNPVTSGTVQDAVNDIADNCATSEAMADFANDLHDYILGLENKTNDDTTDDKNLYVDTVTAGSSATSVTIGGLSYGYYMVYDATTFGTDTSAVRSAVMLNSVTKNVTIELKANRPQIEKYVIDNQENEAKGTSSGVGDTVTFKIVTTVPDHSLYEFYKYKIKDVMPAGFTLVKKSIKVKANNDDITTNPEKCTIEDNKAITSDELELKEVPDMPEGQQVWDFVVNIGMNIAAEGETPKYDAKGIAAGTKIEITYDAILTTAAEKINTNTALLVYSNDPTTVESMAVRNSSANVYTYQMVLSKFAQDINGQYVNIRLAGAEFELYDAAGSIIKFTTTEVTEFDKHMNKEVTYTKYIVNPEGTTTTLKVHEDGDETITLDHLNYGGHKGDLLIFGLKEGTYKLKEVKAPDGYILPEEDFVLTITDEIGSLGSVTTLGVTGSHAGTGTIVNARGTAESILTVWADITNKPGSALPSTGGMGTTLFTILGVILMAGAVAYLVVRRKKATA